MGTDTNCRLNSGIPRLLLTVLVRLALCLFPLTFHASTQTTNILILKSGPSSVYDDVVDHIKNHFDVICPKHGFLCDRLNIQSFIANEAQPTKHKYDLVITLGLKARQYAMINSDYSNVINAMIPNIPSNLLPTETGTKEVQTLILDQPVGRSLNLIKKITPATRHVGILISSSNKNSIATLIKAGQKLGLVIHPKVIVNGNEIGRKLSQLLKDIDVFLALPDKEIHNRKTVSNILLSTYRKKIPLFGFSAAYVRAGALAAIYSTPEDIGRHIVETTERILSKQFDPGLPHTTVEYPKYFSVSVNTQVAHSLEILLPAAPEEIEKQIQRSER